MRKIIIFSSLYIRKRICLFCNELFLIYNDLNIKKELIIMAKGMDKKKIQKVSRRKVLKIKKLQKKKRKINDY